MNGPLINILIRLSAGREESFKRCVTSINHQKHRNIKVFISVDCDIEPYRETLAMLDFDPVIIQVTPNPENGEFFYNDYCNDLKALVTEGWFFFLDSDDYLASTDSLEQIAYDLQADVWQAVVCQLSRDSGRIKPSTDQIKAKVVESGHIGLPCLFLRAQYRDALKIGVEENADFLWIQTMTANLATKYVAKIVVHAPKRSYGI